ncbi:hypothetical protein K437DRAFT_169700 [Tilletiaria anomala UBC 951]|uniref:Uncharacterized protein n=1 Tax=Tilletiaria anomala (strain ATCC 24038 / CBS 436.72 / UBC 951) TaxID=1037660 RepID=A0A066VSW1_TILAU|nr:uncharacterized protein K437DRAFT_169700 [Tilletiaria anomala UBC 951]KDN41879.1 hypothetical protein K437DRAFT_169700 [Tilletiaria anomala UBC 951]
MTDRIDERNSGLPLPNTEEYNECIFVRSERSKLLATANALKLTSVQWMSFFGCKTGSSIKCEQLAISRRRSCPPLTPAQQNSSRMILSSWTHLIGFIAAEAGSEYYREPASKTQDIGLAYYSKYAIKAHILLPQPTISKPIAFLASCAQGRTTHGQRIVARLLIPWSREQIGTTRAVSTTFVQPPEEAKAPKEQ